MVDDEILNANDRIKVVALTVIAGTQGPQLATLTLDVDGQHQTVQARGNGPVDATFNAIKAIVPNEAQLELYQVHAVTEGTDAQAEVSVRLSEDGKSVTARSAGPGHPGRLGPGLCRRAQQAHGQAPEGQARSDGELSGGLRPACRAGCTPACGA